MLAHLIEVCGNLVFDAVGDFLIFDEFVIHCFEFLMVRGIYGLTDVTEAVTADFSKMDEFLLSLVERKFRSAERTSRDIFESEHLSLALRFLDKPYDSLLDKRSEPYKHTGVCYVEERMKHCNAVKKRILVNLHFGWICRHSAVGDHSKLTACLYRIIEAQRLHYDADKSDDRIKQDKHPDHTYHIEYRMSTCRSLCRCIGDCSSDVGCNGCTDVLSKYHRHCQSEVNQAGSGKKHRDGHRRT